MECFTVNWRFVPVKAGYFFMLGGVASLLPFLAVYMRQAGLSELETAVVYGTMPFLGAFVRPLFGAVADAWQKHKAVLFTCCLLTAIFHALLLAVPHHPYSMTKAISRGVDSSDVWVTLKCNPGGSRVHFCPADVLLARGCSERAINMSTVDSARPLESMKNCSMHCNFIPHSNATELCIHGIEGTQSASVCPLKRLRNRETFTPKHTVTQLKKHMHVFHHVMRNYLSRGIFFEVEHLVYLGDDAIGNVPRDKYFRTCYNYALQEIEYNDTDIKNVSIQCDVDSSLKCNLDCEVLPNLDHFPGFDCAEKKKHDSPDTRFGRIFWMFFLIYFVAQIWFAPIFNLNDGIVYDYLGPNRYSWGRHRLWGTVGFMLFALISGLAMDIFSDNGFSSGRKNYMPAFVLFAVNNILAACVVLAYRISPEVRVSQLFQNMSTLLRKLEVLSLLTVVFVFGAFTGVIETFLYWHLVDLGSPQWLLGWCMFFNCIPEVFLLFFSGYILHKIGHVNALYIVFVAYFVRLITYAFITTPAYVLFVEPLHGVTFGLMYAAASSYASEVTPPGMHGTTQGLIAGLHFGVGKGVGSVSGGWVATWVELHHMFLFYSIMSLFCLAAYVAFNTYLGRRQAARGREVSMRDGKHEGRMRNGSAASRDDDDEENGTRMSTLMEDLSVGFDGDKQALVFKDDPDT